ncbi:MAG: beta-galactosidase, partial [Candidatus Bathyarchaeota archaeon]|nr:beta-galactosidase [Candidatus Bathyarchaeota archaeon]
KIDGKFWLVDPEGNLFISKGVNHVNYWSDYAPTLNLNPYSRVVSRKYGSADAWAEETINRLRSWGFNTIGAWSSEETFTKGMPYTIILNIALEAGADWESGNITDYFSEDFAKAADEVAKEFCAARRDDRHLIGYFTDNELRWTADWRSQREIFDDYMLLPPDSEGKKALVGYLEEKHTTISSLNQAWGTTFPSFEEILTLRETPRNQAADSDRLGFIEVASRRYFRTCYDAIKRYDANHLILGVRYAFKPPDEALKGCVGYVDVLSMNCYANPDRTEFRDALINFEKTHNVTGLPIMVTEFSFKAMDSGLPNTRGAGVPVRSQSDKADFYEEYVKTFLAQPFTVGYHWFQYADQPAEGRFDGENSNFGLVTITDEPWNILVDRATAVNLQAEQLHSGE